MPEAVGQYAIDLDIADIRRDKVNVGQFCGPPDNTPVHTSYIYCIAGSIKGVCTKLGKNVRDLLAGESLQGAVE